ncbi:hypothetical protein V8G54_025822 [Vigna mungo]|uniref:Reverse transcriptase Ty1/copia-type domain-containing protein n=1 Tax=Vigna mungo TaxID=3915 RepID=A0AAQ3MYG3_VIGMU
MVAALTNESATSKSVYFAHCTSEMIFITHLLAEEPEKLAGPLLADTYVTLLKGRNAWYGQKLAKGELNLEMGDNIKGKGMIQRYKTHLVAEGFTHSHMALITLSPDAKPNSIRLRQFDVKNAFLNGYLVEECIRKPLQDMERTDNGLKQRAWFEKFTQFTSKSWQGILQKQEYRAWLVGCMICFAENYSSRVSDAHTNVKEVEKIGAIWLSFVTSKKQIAGVFTKGLPKPSFKLFVKQVGHVRPMLRLEGGGVSAVRAFYELLSHSSLNVLNPEENKHVAPVELCPILKMLYRILIAREYPTQAILQALRDETTNDPRDRIEIAQSHVFYRPSLLGHKI